MDSLCGKIREDALLFGESQSRAIVSLNKENVHILENIALKHGVPMQVIGKVGGDRLFIEGLIDIPISRAYEAWVFGFEGILR
ncbi:MAG: hypothetical protein C4291_03025 [Candidatus Dadabacteria bacterium]